MTLKRRSAILFTALTLMLGVAACGDDDDSVEPGNRGDSPSAVGEPGSDASETGGGGTPAEGVEDQSDEN